MGVTYDRVTIENEYLVANEDLRNGDFVVKKGTVSCITTRMCGYLKNASKSFMPVEVNWAFTHAQLPPGV